MKEFKESKIYFKLYSFHGVYEKERILFLHENKKVQVTLHANMTLPN